MNYPQLFQQIRSYEDFRPTPYKDSRGLWTFGIGRCLETSPLTAQEWKALLDNGEVTLECTGAGADRLVAGRISEVNQELLTKWAPYTHLPDAVQDVLVDMAYQMGVTGLLGFTTFLALVANRQYSLAAADVRASTAWYKQTPQRAESLMKQLEAV